VSLRESMELLDNAVKKLQTEEGCKWEAGGSWNV
jgi:hypothetical protein